MAAVIPFVQDADFTLIHGDALSVLRELPDESIDCCVTSPPYWGLRDYGTGAWDGGDPVCDHLQKVGGLGKSTLAAKSGGWAADRITPETERASQERQRVPFREICGKCGARRVDRQLGLESTPDEYVARMVAVFREVRRCLADTGTLWLNLGDSYNNNGYSSGAHLPSAMPTYVKGRGRGKTDTLKPKDLVGIPWRVGFALQADGWYLRSDIIWAKPNPMPESVTDRPTKAHEYVFLLSKSPRYWFDSEAIREANAPTSTTWGETRQKASGNGQTAQGIKGAFRVGEIGIGRNVRSVWEIATQPYPEAHFAVFPEELPRRCILAGCPEGGTVLDPFGGSGTTALVARRHGRRSVLIELNEAYCDLAAKRLQQLSLLSPACSPTKGAA